MINNITIVIPTWNSMPELETTLSSICKAIPKKVIKDIIIMDKSSKDGTINIANKFGCKIYIDNKSLGSARMVGIKKSRTKWICFIDSDIELPDDWYKSINSHITSNTGMIYGRTIDSNEKIGKMQIRKMSNDLSGKCRKLKCGERGFTHNTLVLKKLIDDVDISNYNAWEDWVITQAVINNGYDVLEAPVMCKHNHFTKEKFGFIRTGWSTVGSFQVVGITPYTIGYMLYPLFEGLRSTITFKDIFYLQYGLLALKESIVSVITNRIFKRD